MKRKLLIIFCKNPQLGKVKTRIAATLGDEKALAIYYKLVNYTQQITTPLSVDKVVYYSDYIDREDNWDNNIFEKELQKGNDLGEKILNAFKDSFEKGYRFVSIIGTDCLELTTEIIESSFTSMDNHQAVIGPALDGGYYLLGMSSFLPSIFEGKSWSTNSVLSDTVKDFERMNIEFSKLKILRDVDHESDLPYNFVDQLNK